jgi:hypothetical protein
VIPTSRWMPFSSTCICLRSFWSSAPSGSSSSSTEGRLTSARASATRCFWPPESSRGRAFSRPRSSTGSRASATRVRSRQTPPSAASARRPRCPPSVQSVRRRLGRPVPIDAPPRYGAPSLRATPYACGAGRPAWAPVTSAHASGKPPSEDGGHPRGLAGGRAVARVRRARQAPQGVSRPDHRLLGLLPDLPAARGFAPGVMGRRAGKQRARGADAGPTGARRGAVSE